MRQADVAALLAFPKADGKEVRVPLGLKLCMECSEAVAFNSLLTRRGYKRLRTEMAAQGIEVPSRGEIKVVYVHLRPQKR